MQVKFTTRSGSNKFVGSAYHFFQNDSAEHEHRMRTGFAGCRKAKDRLNQPGFRQGGPVIIPGVFNGRDKLFFFVNYEESRSPDTITTNSTLLLPDAQNGIFRYHGRTGRRHQPLRAGGSERSHLDADPTVANLLRDIRAAATAIRERSVRLPAI